MKTASGMVYKRDGKYFLILSKESKNDKAGYVIQSDSSGMPLENLRIKFESSLSFDVKDIVCLIPMKRHCVELGGVEYVWHTINMSPESPVIRAINSEMSQLDARYRLFIDTASDTQKEIYTSYENINFHDLNDRYVSLYAEFFEIQHNLKKGL